MTIAHPFVLWILLAASTLTVMAGAIIAPVLNLMREGLGVADPASFRGRITSYLGSFGFIGQFLSPIIFRPLVLTTGLQSVFLAAGATSALLFLLFLVFMKK